MGQIWAVPHSISFIVHMEGETADEASVGTYNEVDTTLYDNVMLEALEGIEGIDLETVAHGRHPGKIRPVTAETAS